MKKAITWISIITFIILLIDLGIMGLKILEHNYNIIIEGYIGSTCYLIFFTCIILKFFTNKCQILPSLWKRVKMIIAPIPLAV